MGLILPYLMTVSVAVAQDDGQVAKQFYLNGKMLFEEGRYEEAIIAWEKAYEKSEKPVILYNISIAYEKLRLYQQAIDTLYKYRIYAPLEEQADLVAKIEELKLQLESDLTLESNQSEEEYQIDKVQIADTKSEVIRVTEPAEQSIPEEVQTSAIDGVHDEIPLGVANNVPLYTAWGLGAASLGTGVIFGVLANQSNNMAEYVGGCGTTNKGLLLCTSDSEGEAYYWEARQQSIIADVCYGMSAMSLGAAVWLTFREADTSSKNTISTVWVAPNSVGLQRRF